MDAASCKRAHNLRRTQNRYWDYKVELHLNDPYRTRRGDEGRHDHLLRQQARLRGLRAQAQVLPERARTQDRALGPRSCSRQGARYCKDRGLRCLTPRTKEG